MAQLKELLAEARRLKGVSLREVERCTEISNAYVSQLESGSVAEPSPRILHKLADYYGISYQAVMEAAGYLVPAKEGRPASTDLMFMGDKLTPEEGRAMAAFYQHLKGQRDGKKR